MRYQCHLHVQNPTEKKFVLNQTIKQHFVILGTDFHYFLKKHPEKKRSILLNCVKRPSTRGRIN